MIILDEKIYLWLFWALPAVLGLFLLSRWWRKHAQDKFADPVSLKKLSPEKSRFKPILKLIFFMLALVCLVMALVNPKMGSKLETVTREGVDIVFAVDVSKSMLAEDVAPNRLDKSKQIVQRIIDQLKGDRVGIIAYAGSAVPQLPITTDYGAAKLFLDNLNTDMMSSKGTAIAEAIRLSLEYYDDDSKTSRVLFLLTDGEDHEGEIEALAKEAAKKNIHIFSIGMGTAKGGRIPLKVNGVTREYLKDMDGETVLTKMDESTLRRIAKITQGDYVSGRQTTEVLKQVEGFLDGLNASEIESKQFASFRSQFQWFLGFGILFMVLEMLLLERKTAWLERLNLFNEKKSDEE